MDEYVEVEDPLRQLHAAAKDESTVVQPVASGAWVNWSDVDQVDASSAVWDAGTDTASTYYCRHLQESGSRMKRVISDPGVPAEPSQACPCRPTTSYAACCQPVHAGRAPAATAETLMRSRYSAYVLGLRDYLLHSWHPDTRPAELDLDDTPGLRWLGLDVKRHVDAGDDTAIVEFVALYRVGGKPAVRMHEVSRFERVDGRWLYVDGELS